jgi:hypothetical protein
MVCGLDTPEVITIRPDATPWRLSGGFRWPTVPWYKSSSSNTSTGNCSNEGSMPGQRHAVARNFSHSLVAILTCAALGTSHRLLFQAYDVYSYGYLTRQQLQDLLLDVCPMPLAEATAVIDEVCGKQASSPPCLDAPASGGPKQLESYHFRHVCPQVTAYPHTTTQA